MNPFGAPFLESQTEPLAVKNQIYLGRRTRRGLPPSDALRQLPGGHSHFDVSSVVASSHGAAVLHYAVETVENLLPHAYILSNKEKG